MFFGWILKLISGWIELVCGKCLNCVVRLVLLMFVWFMLFIGRFLKIVIVIGFLRLMVFGFSVCCGFLLV